MTQEKPINIDITRTEDKKYTVEVQSPYANTIEENTAELVHVNGHNMYISDELTIWDCADYDIQKHGNGIHITTEQY